MSPSSFNFNGFRGEASFGSGAQLSHAVPSPLIENQLTSPADIGKAHQFFQPGAAQAQIGNQAIGQAALGKTAIGHAALGHAAMVPGADGGSLAVKVLQLAQAQISPIIQLIMRMPGHIGLMSSAFEAFANFFLPHTELIGGLDPSLLASAHGDIGFQFESAASLGEHVPLDFHVLPHDAPFLQDVELRGLNFDEGGLATGSEHGFDLSYVNEHLFHHSDLTVSGVLDPAKPQFEGLTFNDPHGELISGPSLSHSSPATHLADNKSLLLEKGFHQANAGNPAAMAASSGSSSATSMPSNLAQPTVPSSVPVLPSALNVGSSSFGAQPSVSAAVGALGTGDGGGSLSTLSSSGGVLDTGSFGPSGAVSDKLGGQQLLAMNNTGSADIAGGPTNGSEYGANFLKSQQSSAPAEGLKAKELTLDSVKSGHKLASTNASQGNALERLHKQSHEIAKHSTGHSPNKSVSSSKISSSAATAKAGTASNANSIARADDSAATTGDGQATETAADYKIQSGDCLWNIAKDKLGDATKWTEIFKLNSDTLGSNPSLIHPGTTIHLPGQSLAQHAGEAAKYVVKSGDNLWNISKSHLGDATKWGEIYKLNHEIIGANPSLIMPGTELTLPGAGYGASGQLADASGAVAGAPDASAAPTAAAGEQMAAAAPDTNTPAVFGHPNGSLHAPEAHTGSQPVAQTHLPPQSLDTSLPPSGAATAAPALGPGAAGAATIPVPSVFGSPSTAANSPENASVVSSSVGNDLANFLSRKK